MWKRGRHWWVGGAVVWCCLFAGVHVFWALGGGVGLASSAGAGLADRRPVPFVVFGLWGVAALLVAGAVVVGWSARAGLVRRWRVLCGWAVGVVGAGLLARGVLVEVALAVDAGGVRRAVGPAESWWSLVLWNPWFVLGGVLFVGVGVRLGGRRAGGAGSGPPARPRRSDDGGTMPVGLRDGEVLEDGAGLEHVDAQEAG